MPNKIKVSQIQKVWIAGHVYYKAVEEMQEQYLLLMRTHGFKSLEEAIETNPMLKDLFDKVQKSALIAETALDTYILQFLEKQLASQYKKDKRTSKQAPKATRSRVLVKDGANVWTPAKRRPKSPEEGSN